MLIEHKKKKMEKSNEVMLNFIILTLHLYSQRAATQYQISVEYYSKEEYFYLSSVPLIALFFCFFLLHTIYLFILLLILLLNKTFTIHTKNKNTQNKNRQ